MKIRKKIVIGLAAYISSAYFKKIPARIDTGARTTAIWASNIYEKDGVLYFQFFAKGSEYFDNVTQEVEHYETRVVISSNGGKQIRYLIPITLEVKKLRIRTFATLADRSKQAFPILIGRNTLRGKFLVDAQKVSQKLSQIDKKAFVKLQDELKGDRK